MTNWDRKGDTGIHRVSSTVWGWPTAQDLATLTTAEVTTVADAFSQAGITFVPALLALLFDRAKKQVADETLTFAEVLFTVIAVNVTTSGHHVSSDSHTLLGPLLSCLGTIMVPTSREHQRPRTK